MFFPVSKQKLNAVATLPIWNYSDLELKRQCLSCMAFFLQRLGSRSRGLTVTQLVPGGHSWEFMVGMCRLVLQILTRFQTQKWNFPNPFSDLAFRQKLCYHCLDQSANKHTRQIISYSDLELKRQKPLPDGAAHTYIAYIREYPPPGVGLTS